MPRSATVHPAPKQSGEESTRTQRAVNLLRSRFFGRPDIYLSEKHHKVKEPLTDDVLALHLMGEERIGIYPGEAGASYIGWDFDGKNPRDKPIGTDEAWRQLKAVEAVVREVGLPSILAELTRSSKGFRGHLLFDPKHPPSTEQAKRFGKLTLKAAAIPDDEKESEGHPGVYPHPPKSKDQGGKEVGKTVFLPWCGLLNGAENSVFVDSTTREPLAPQEEALEVVELVTKDRLQEAIAGLEKSLAKPASTVTAKSGTALAEDQDAEPPGSAVPTHRHDTLVKLGLTLRNYVPEKKFTHGYLNVLAEKWGIYDDRPEEAAKEVRDAVESAYEKEPLRVQTPYELYQREHNQSEFNWRSVPFYDLVTAEPQQIPWLIEGFAAKDECGVLTSQPKEGKTYILCQCAIDSTLGRPALGLFYVPKPLRVLFADEEMGRRKLQRRLQRLTAGLGLTEDELREIGSRLDIRPQQGLSLADPKHRDAFRRTIDATEPDLILMDSLVAFQSGEENSATDRRRFYNEILAPIKAEYGCAIILAAHPPLPSKDQHGDSKKRPRGSGDILAQVDRSFWMCKSSEQKTPESFTVTSTLEPFRSREGGDIDPVVVTIDGLLTEPVTVRATWADSASGQQQIGKAQACELAILKTLRTQDEREVYQPELKKHCDDAGYKKDVYYEAIKNLQNNGAIRQGPRRRGGTGFFIVLTEGEDD